jgi:NAD(P)-dependent dehydrogenase (short-subunit alcohol dehydrogenase family)
MEGEVNMGLLEAHAGLAGKVAVVLGGCGEIQGRAISLALADAGVHVAACDVDAAAVKSIVPEVEARGVRMLATHADVTDGQALDRFYDEVERTFDRVDILVNLPGGVERGAFVDTTPEQNARDIRLNYGYVIDSVRRAIPLIRKGGRGGSIVNFTTIEAFRGAATFAVYAGAKAATTNFSRALAVELAADKIRVNAIAPDTSPAKTSNATLKPQDLERIAALGPNALQKILEFYVPMQEQTPVEDLVNGVLFLASDLSKSMTGQTLHIDGGTSASWGFLNWPVDGYMPAPLGAFARLFPEAAREGA